MLTIMLLAALAAPSAGYSRCLARIDHGGFVKSQMLACATADMDRADAALNRRYRAVMGRLPPARRTQLRDEERGWIDRRRAQCRAAMGEQIPSPEISRMLCLVHETDARTAYLATVR